jgi:hypothetical protein
MTGPAADPQDAWTPCFASLGEAEWSRLQGRPDPQAWQRAAEHWERLELLYRAAYARFRQAEALLAARAPRAQIQPVLQAAHMTAVALGARPLRGEIELLAGRGRLGLEQPVAAVAAPESLSSPAASLGLTHRETEVLALVAAGRTNRQIGQALFITPKTASVHVQDPGQTGGGRSRRGGRDRPPTRARQAMIRRLGQFCSRTRFGDVSSGRATHTLPRLTRLAARPSRVQRQPAK